MKHLHLGILVAICVVIVQPNLASAAPISVKKETVTQEDKKLTDATVNLYCRIKVGNKEMSTTGTGVIIDPRGVILTNAHVAQYFLLNGENSKLNANCSVRTGSPAKEMYAARVLYISSKWLETATQKTAKEISKGTGENDFALLYISEAKAGKLPPLFPFVPLGIVTPVKKGDEVSVIGYPAGDLKFKEIRNKLKVEVATTTVTNLQSFKANTTDLISLSRTKLASSGVSGAPVVLSNTVAGIVSTRSTSKKSEGASLRAISVPYINRAVMNEVNLSLFAIYGGNLTARADATAASISEKTFSAIEKPLRLLR